ncbi:YceI family protein [uncultured Winogradskyella sp.]|uniref:YceI family protein n=1 Tax=uncultured Winogradskyella sp. TaxID=395353 RepID=UPI0030EEBBEB|tara:strand:- start:101 stop:649 length:549 start_codon:yes stop_codon:yes gene_type:complete
MKKHTFLIAFCFLVSLQLHAQKYFTRSGITQFEASEKAFEPIEAINSSTTVILDTNNGNIASQVFIAGFQFKNALMQEHFNENYMDSYQYPKATFKGKLDNFSIISLNANNSYDLNGVLTIKGIKKNIQTTVSVKVENNRIFISGSFYVNANDFDIKIPSIVRDKIAKQIEISIDYELIEKK